jgi:hypothetical protein
MSDRTPAEIWIGGQIPASLVPSLCRAIVAEGVALGWGESHIEPTSADDLRNACSHHDGADVLWLCDDQSLMGRFEYLEEFLQANRVAFRRRCDGTCEYDRELVEYHPKLGLFAGPVNAAGEPVIPVVRIRAVETDLAETLELVNHGDRRGVAALRSVCKLLHKQLPPLFPPLEPFEIGPPD